MHLDLTLDCSDPARLATFWRAALGYVDAPPPVGSTRRQWFADLGLPAGDEWLASPDPALPRLYLQRVPEAKTVKNRLHLDIRLDDDDLIGNELAGDELAGDELAGDELAGDEPAGDEPTGGGTAGDHPSRWARVLAEVARLESLGASVLHRSESDRSAGRFVVLADPEGHEFCVG